MLAGGASNTTQPCSPNPTPPTCPPTPPTTQEDATEHVGEVLERVKPEYLRRAYKLQAWEDAEDFLAQVARNTGECCWAVSPHGDGGWRQPGC